MTTSAEGYVRDRFDRLAGRFRSAVAEDDFRLLALRKWLGDARGLLVLDLGCGQGRFGRAMRARGARVVGIDPSRGMLARGPALPRVLGEAGRLPFAGGSFDAAFAVEVFEHLPDPGSALAELARVLRPGGRLVLIDKNSIALDARRPWLPAAAVKALDERRGLWMYPAGAPFREQWFRPRKLARCMETWFDAVEVEPLMRPEERARRVFRCWPATCLFRLWTGLARGGPRHG